MSEEQEISEMGTRKRLLAVAERLFAEQGFESVSLREVTREAEANVAAVNYHFGGKQGLVTEVILQHLLPINAERRKGLEQLVESGDPTVRSVLEAFFHPFVTHILASSQCEQLLMKFLARTADSSADAMPEPMVMELRLVIGEFAKVLMKCAPHLSERDVFWRMHFTFGCFVNSMMQNESLMKISNNQSGEIVIEDLLNEVLDFCTAGFEQGGEK